MVSWESAGWAQGAVPVPNRGQECPIPLCLEREWQQHPSELIGMGLGAEFCHCLGCCSASGRFWKPRSEATGSLVIESNGERFPMLCLRRPLRGGGWLECELKPWTSLCPERGLLRAGAVRTHLRGSFSSSLSTSYFARFQKGRAFLWCLPNAPIAALVLL